MSFLGKTLLLIVALVKLRSGYCQQNFFNVPSSEITAKSKVFFQQQFNFFGSQYVSNSTFTFGLGKGYELGMNAIGLTYDRVQREFIANLENQQPVYPSIGFNAQKGINVSKNFLISLGAQCFFPRRIKETEWYLYLNNKLILERFKLVAGIYVGNNNFFGLSTLFNKEIQTIGVQSGVEFEIIREHLFFQVDYISGKTPISNLIPGLAYKLGKKHILSAGLQLPNDIYNSSEGLIFEYTFNP